MAEDVCIANIGKKGRQQRMGSGVILGVATAAIGGVLMFLGVSRFWRIALFLPAVGSAIGIFQATGHT